MPILAVIWLYLSAYTRLQAPWEQDSHLVLFMFLPGFKQVLRLFCSIVRTHRIKVERHIRCYRPHHCLTEQTGVEWWEEVFLQGHTAIWWWSWNMILTSLWATDLCTPLSICSVQILQSWSLLFLLLLVSKSYELWVVFKLLLCMFCSITKYQAIGGRQK